MCVDLFRRRQRWKLIRRYADSPVYQSVVLNVGSLYAGSPVRQFAGVRRFSGVPICCVERWKFIRRFAGTPIRRCTPIRRYANMLCWTLEVYTPVRRYADSPVYADLPVFQYVVLKRWKLLLRRYADSPAYSSIDLERWKFIVRNNRLADQSNGHFRSLHWLIRELSFELVIHSCSLLIIMKKGRSFPRLVPNNTYQLYVLSAGVFVSCSIKSIRPKQWSYSLTQDPLLAEANPVHNTCNSNSHDKESERKTNLVTFISYNCNEK